MPPCVVRRVVPYLRQTGKLRIGSDIPRPDMGARHIHHRPAVIFRERIVGRIPPIFGHRPQILHLDVIIAPPIRVMRQRAFRAFRIEELVRLVRPLVDGRTTHFIDPGRVELRAAQRLGLIGREGLRRRPVRPDEPPSSRFPIGPAVGRRAGQDPALPHHHHIAHLIEGLADQRHAPRLPGVERACAFHLRTHPLGPGPRLARAASAHDHPGLPIPFGRKLMIQRPELEDPGQREQCIVVEPVEKRLDALRRRGGEPGGARFQLWRHRSRARHRVRRRHLPAVCGVSRHEIAPPSPNEKRCGGP